MEQHKQWWSSYGIYCSAELQINGSSEQHVEPFKALRQELDIQPRSRQIDEVEI